MRSASLARSRATSRGLPAARRERRGGCLGERGRRARAARELAVSVGRAGAPAAFDGGPAELLEPPLGEQPKSARPGGDGRENATEATRRLGPRLLLVAAVRRRRYFGHGGGVGHVAAAGFGNVCLQREIPTNSFVPRKSIGSPVQPRTMPSCALFSMRVWAMNGAAG